MGTPPLPMQQFQTASSRTQKCSILFPAPKNPAMLPGELPLHIAPLSASEEGCKGHLHPGNSRHSGDALAGVPAQQPLHHLTLAPQQEVPAQHAAPRSGARKLLPSQQRLRGIATERLQSHLLTTDFFTHFSAFTPGSERKKAAKWQQEGTEWGDPWADLPCTCSNPAGGERACARPPCSSPPCRGGT